MQKLSKEKYTEIFNSLPESVKDALLSLETVDIIQEIGSKNKLNDASVSALTDLVGDLLMGLVNETDFQKGIEAEVGADSASSINITKELIDKIILPLGKEFIRTEGPLKPTFAVLEAKDADKKPIILEIKPMETFQSIINNEIPQPKPAPSAPQPQTPSIAVKPLFKEAPFIIHQEETISLKNEPNEVKVSTSRQTFYKPNFSEEHKKQEEKPVAAHLELGSDPEKKSEEPKIVESGNSRIRIVNYSNLKTEASPFNPSENIIIKPEENEAPRSEAARYLQNSSKPPTLLRQVFAGFSSPSSPQQAAGYSAKENKPQAPAKEADVLAVNQLNNKEESIQTAEERKTAVNPKNIINLKEENKSEKAEKSSIHPDNVVNLKDIPL